MAIPPEVKVFGLAVGVNLASVKDTAIAHPVPVVLRDGEQGLESTIAA